MKNIDYSNQTVGDSLKHFFHHEAAGGIVLVIAAILGLIVANSPLNPLYNYILNEVTFRIGVTDVHGNGIEIHKSVLLWINDGMMAIFFFLVGLEIKREIMQGELSSRERALLPALAAVGGMIVPALIYFHFNQDHPEYMAGWAIPAATDIAFALGVLALVGSRAPVSLKILLTAIAILDDLGAIIIIALFYTEQISVFALLIGAIALLGMIILNVRGHSRIFPYILLGIVLWICVLKSGVHATLAGVMTALCIPLSCKKDPDYSPCIKMEHGLHPWVAFLILPIFGFANAGVPFAGMGYESFSHPVTMGIFLGLFFGKQIGIFLMLLLAIKLKLSPMPSGASWIQLYGVSILCGVGFTMSLFIGGLAFESVDMQASVRLGVLVGSVASAVLAFCILKFVPSGQKT